MLESREILESSRGLNCKLLSEVAAYSFGTLVGWNTPSGVVYGVVVGKKGKDLLCLTLSDKSLQMDSAVRFYRDDAMSDKLSLHMSGVMMSFQRVPKTKIIKKGRVKGKSLMAYKKAAALLQLECVDVDVIQESQIRQSHEIDKKWLNGIRKWWKGIVGTRVAAGRVRSRKGVMLVSGRAVKYLRKIGGAIEALRHDLYIVKGFRDPKPATLSDRERDWFKKNDPVLYKELVDSEKLLLDAWKSTHLVVEGLGNAVDVIDAAVSDADSAYVDRDLDSMEDCEDAARVIISAVDSAMDFVEGVVGKLFVHLRSLVDEKSDSRGMYVHKMDSHVEDVVNIGKARLLFKDVPTDPRKKYVQIVGRGSLGVDVDVAEPEMNVAARSHFVGEMKRTESLLRQKGLQHLWYGDFVKYPAGTYGKLYRPGTPADAAYVRRFDRVELYYHGIDCETIIHELGHRYWFKFLSSKDRHNFSKWFGKVKSPSEYGSQNSVEEFAELFVGYVLGKPGKKKIDLDKDQISRFKQFLGRRRKLENFCSKSEVGMITEKRWIQKAVKKPGRLPGLLGLSQEEYDKLSKSVKLQKIDAALKALEGQSGTGAKSKRGALILGKRFVAGRLESCDDVGTVLRSLRECIFESPLDPDAPWMGTLEEWTEFFADEFGIELSEEPVGSPERDKAVIKWVRKKFGAAKALAHREFLKKVRKDPAAHRRKMAKDRKYHRLHKWHDVMMKRTARPGWARRRMRELFDVCCADVVVEVAKDSGDVLSGKERSQAAAAASKKAGMEVPSHYQKSCSMDAFYKNVHYFYRVKGKEWEGSDKEKLQRAIAASYSALKSACGITSKEKMTPSQIVKSG